MKKGIINIIVFLFCSLLLTGCDKTGTCIPVTSWKIMYNSTADIESVSQIDKWEAVSMPARFKLKINDNDSFNYIWLMSEFSIPDNVEKIYGISTGKIYHVMDMYINGRKNASFSEHDFNSFHPPSGYVIRNGILKNGLNRIHIRLGIYRNEFGGITGDVFALDRDSFNKSQLFYDFFFRQAPMGLVFFLAGIMVILFLFFLWNRQEKMFIYSTLILLVNIIYIMAIFSPYRILSYDTSVTVQWAAFPLISMFSLLNIQAMYRIYLSHFNRIVFPVLMVLFCFMIAGPLIFSNWVLADISGFICMLVVFPCFAYIIYRLKSIKPDRFRSNVLTSILFFLGLVFIWNMISNLTGSRYSELQLTYTSPFFIMSFTLLAARDYMKRWMEVECLYDKLKNMDTGQNPLPITDATEKKLEMIIDFLNQNYTSDISREGLAAAIDMNTNYMSRLFKTYTGQKINEYINSLRIEDAKDRLFRSDERIIDIAFSVGYESLATFNRVFKNSEGKTPTEYKISRNNAN